MHIYLYTYIYTSVHALDSVCSALSTPTHVAYEYSVYFYFPSPKIFENIHTQIFLQVDWKICGLQFMPTELTRSGNIFLITLAFRYAEY